MCQYKFVENKTESLVNGENIKVKPHKFTRRTETPCKIHKYYNLIDTEEKNLPKDLPIDENGLCIFHSQDIEWKMENDFMSIFFALLEVIAKISEDEINFEFPNAFKDFDLRGTICVGEEYELHNGQTIIQAELENLVIGGDVCISMDRSIFLHTFRMINCDFSKSDIDLKHSTFHEEVVMSQLKIHQISLDDTVLKEGIHINNSEFKGYVEFCGMNVQHGFNVQSSSFLGSSFWVETIFNTEFWSMDDTYFQDLADFTEVTFTGEMSITNCTFEQELRYRDTNFQKSAVFQSNAYYGNVFFRASDNKMKIFNDYVYFSFADPADLEGQLSFENVNFSNIVEDDRKTLLRLSRENKVVIGKGCIKYKAQTKPIKIKINHINHNIVTELAHSFGNYFLYSNGFNLGVEFIDKQINSIQLFYFTDEDITSEELYERLNKCEQNYWNFTAQDSKSSNSEDLISAIDSYVSKLSILSKISLRKEHQLWSEELTQELLKTITYGNGSISPNQINIVIENLKIKSMKINKVITNGGQVNIAERIEQVHYQTIDTSLQEKDFNKIKQLLLKLDANEIEEIQHEMQNINPSNLTPLKEKIEGFFYKHSIPISQSLTASAIFETLKILVGI